MGNQQATFNETHMAWLAGIIEGEGSIGMGVGVREARNTIAKVKVSVVIYNTDEGIINQCCKVLDWMSVPYHVAEKTQNSQIDLKNEPKPMFFVRLRGFLQVRDLLEKLMPWFFGSKKQRAELVLRYLNRRIQRIEDNGGNWRNLSNDEGDYELVKTYCRLPGNRIRPETVKRVLNELERCAQGTA